jgi:hypothetical protein
MEAKTQKEAKNQYLEVESLMSSWLWKFFIFFIPAAIVQLKSHICCDVYATQVRDVRLLLLVMLENGAV